MNLALSCCLFAFPLSREGRLCKILKYFQTTFSYFLTWHKATPQLSHCSSAQFAGRSWRQWSRRFNLSPRGGNYLPDCRRGGQEEEQAAEGEEAVRVGSAAGQRSPRAGQGLPAHQGQGQQVGGTWQDRPSATARSPPVSPQAARKVF